MAASAQNPVFANAMIQAFVSAGLVKKGRIKRDGYAKKTRSTESGAYWPRLKRGQASYTRREVM